MCHSPRCFALNTKFGLCVSLWPLALNSNLRNLLERSKDRPHAFRGMVTCCHLAVLLYSSQSAMDIDFWPSSSRQVTSFLWYSAVTLSSGFFLFFPEIHPSASRLMKAVTANISLTCSQNYIQCFFPLLYCSQRFS